MKILLITVRSDFGGGPRHVDQLVKELPSKCEIYMAYPEKGEPYSDLWRNDNRVKETLFIPYRKFTFKVLLELDAFVRKNGIEIIHSHGNGAGLYSRLLKMIEPKVKVVHTFHGISDEYSSNIKFYLSRIMGIVLSPLADRYIAVSNGEKALGVKWGFCKDSNCNVIYNGIEDEGQGEINMESRIIVTLSRYDYQKNMELCLDVVRKMRDDNVRFVWVGDGDDFAKIQTEIEQEKLPVEMVGYQTKPMSFLKKASVYLSTSRFEGLPYSLIEAASVGLPLVATDVKGNNEVAINNNNGLTFMTAEEGAIALRKILDDRRLYDQMSKNSRILYKERFTVKVMVGNLLKLYNSII